MFKFSYLKILTCCCLTLALLGVLARFTVLTVSFEYDELFTAVTVNPTLPLGWIWSHWLAPDVHPPLHNILLYFYNHFLPYGPEIWMRLPSVLCGLGALACGWFLFPKRLGRTARVIFVSMMACNTLLIFFSQYARAYALMLCLSVPLTFLFLEMSRAVMKGRVIAKKQWGWFAGVSLVLCWSHYFGALLFGVFSVLLLAQAVFYKRKLGPFILVPAAVFVCFLPWLAPNLWTNISQERFGGNWWANRLPPHMIAPGLLTFFFSSLWGHLLIACLLMAGLVFNYRIYKRSGRFWQGYEVTCLLAALGLGFLLMGLLAFKINLFLGRYFIVFIPALYLLCALLLARAVQKKWWMGLLFAVFLCIGLVEYVRLARTLLQTPYLSARPTAEAYQKQHADKELFVVALEAFPPAAMEAMYGFYPNQIFGMNKKVTELNQLDEAARDAVLARRKDALIWMPNCDDTKLKKISEQWNRAILVHTLVGSSCFFEVTDKGVLQPENGFLPANTEK